MNLVNTHQELQKSETENLKAFVRSLGIVLVGIADLELLEGMPVGIKSSAAPFPNQYRYAVVLGAQNCRRISCRIGVLL